MYYRQLGKSGIVVSELCFGSLTIGPLQANLPVDIGAEVISAALTAGVNFIDTAELYDNYAYIKSALQKTPNDVVITSKSYAYTAEQMAASVEKARKQLNRDVIDIFLLHEQESALTLKGHWPALQYLLAMKAKGIVRAVGISTHHIAAVEAAAELPEIDVIHPLLNMLGIGIADGSAIEMIAAIEKAAASGKGIYAMKALAGGHLSNDALNAIGWVRANRAIASIAIGMQSLEEVDYNVRLFDKKEITTEMTNQLNKKVRRLLVEDHCCVCGECVKVCRAKALRIEDGALAVDHAKCRLCSYCASACRDFCIKVV